MKRVLFFLYGILSYTVFLASFLYTIGFVANLIVPKSIDAGEQGGTGSAWLVDILLLSLFALQHSIMARQGFKRWWTRIVPRVVERSTYVLFSSLALVALLLFWRPIEGLAWDVRGSALGPLLMGVYFAGWGIVLFGSFLINHFNLFGVEQVYMSLRRRELFPPRFVRPFFYRIVRHPLMLGFIIAFWATPLMTVGHLLFACASTGYILVGIQLEERDLVRLHGEDYRRYQREVSQIIPLPPRKEVGADAVPES